MPFPHVAVKVPAMVVAVCDAIWYWKFPQELGLGNAADAFESHPPTSEGLALEPPGVGVPLPPGAPSADGDVGELTLDERSNAQAPAASVLNNNAPRVKPVLGILQTCRPALENVCTGTGNQRVYE